MTDAILLLTVNFGGLLAMTLLLRGIWVIVLDLGWAPALASVIGPVFLTFTLTRWPGKALLEKRLHKARPGYADHVRRTSGFLPWPPKIRV